MADGGLTKVFRYLFRPLRCDNGSASNAIYAQIFKTLWASIQNNDMNKLKRELWF
jgi:hypothetical protein